MKCIRKIRNLVLGKIIEYQEQNADVVNKPNTKETYIICPGDENPYSEQIIKANLSDVHSLYDGTFGNESDEHNYVISLKSSDVNVVPFMVALKANKKILPVYISNGEKLVISYSSPFEVKDCYTRSGSFDYSKIYQYIDKWHSSIEKAKQKSKKVVKNS